MKRTEIIKTMLQLIGEDIERDKALAQGCILLLGGADPKEPANAETPKTEPKAEPKKAEPKREPFDIGKMKALYDRGWSAAMVADEMGVSVQTIYNKAKKEGLKFGKAVSV